MRSESVGVEREIRFVRHVDIHIVQQVNDEEAGRHIVPRKVHQYADTLMHLRQNGCMPAVERHRAQAREGIPGKYSTDRRISVRLSEGRRCYRDKEEHDENRCSSRCFRAIRGFATDVIQGCTDRSTTKNIHIVKGRVHPV